MVVSEICRADIDPLSGIDFVRITHPGNAAWPGNGNPVDRAIGRGRVDYEYSIGRMEVTTSQAVEFFNAAYDRPRSEWLPHLIPPTFWGAVQTQPTTPGGRRWTVPAGNELRPVGNLSWRMGAMLANWYHNGKVSGREAFLNGAYDVSTFGFNGNIFTDQLAHSPGARYWIPTWDEWLKAAHWSPARQHPTLGGWWVYSNGTDQPLVGAPPGVAGAQANFGWNSSDFPGQSPFSVPLRSYGTVGPWGLLDAAGGTNEWTETVRVGSDGVRVRISDGSYWNSCPGSAGLDAMFGIGSEFPHISSYEFGLRLASSVPTPGPCIIGAGLLFIIGCTRRRRR